jgi:hypothetical protein
METMEKAALHGLFVPSIRLLLLAIIVHLSAVFNPVRKRMAKEWWTKE